MDQDNYKTANKIYMHFKNAYPNYFKYNQDLNPENIGTIIKQTKTEINNPQQIKRLITIIETKIKNYKPIILTSETYKDNSPKYSPIITTKEPTSTPMDTKQATPPPIIKEPKLAELPDIPPENIDTQFDRLTNKFTHRDREYANNLMEEVKQKKEYYLLIDSKDRKTSVFPNANSFTVDFAPSDTTSTGYIDRKFANVVSIELIDALLHKTEETPAPPYLIINIDETGGLYYATNTYAKSAFAILISPKTIGDYDYYDFTDKNAIVKEFPQHRNITRLSIKILCSDGTDYNFGNTLNASNNTVALFRFKLTCIEQSINTNYLNQN